MLFEGGYEALAAEGTAGVGVIAQGGQGVVVVGVAQPGGPVFDGVAHVERVGKQGLVPLSAMGGGAARNVKIS